MIYTFYSYKGGVGRSMALANIAELFYQAGRKVLMVDWDLEAPGLERFFPVDLDQALDNPGVIDMLLEYKRQMAQGLPTSGVGDLPFKRPDQFVIDVYPDMSLDSSDQGRLWLIPAGKRSKEHFAEYVNAVLTFDWQDFYENWEGELYFEWLRRRFELMADIVLIDSRTGLTEMGGVCTYQLANAVIMFCTPNQQSLDGVYEMAQSLKQPNVRRMRRDRPLEILIVPARVEEKAETRLLKEFRNQFVKKFTQFLPEALRSEPDSIWDARIPYIPYYAFNEVVAMRERGETRAEDMIEAFDSLCRIMLRLERPSTITWLHLSDLHFHRSRPYDQNTLLKALLQDVSERIQNDNLRPDFIAVTGDIAFSGKPDEYAMAQAFFDDLLSVTSLPRERLFVVPGNHDVDRSLITEAGRSIGTKLVDRAAVNKFLYDSDSKRLALARFRGYREFVNGYLDHLTFDEQSFFYVELLELNEQRVALLGLNSAWVSGSDQDKGSMIIGERQVREALESVQKTNANLRIALLHHPFEWLQDFDQYDSEALLLNQCDFVLHGHLHRTALARLTSPDSGAMTIMGGACYETRQYPNSYNFVRLDLSVGTGTVYLRRYSDDHIVSWTTDTDLFRNVPDGVYTFALRESIFAAAGPPPESLEFIDEAKWSIGAVRELLATALSDEELIAFSFDYFGPAYETFSSGMGKMQKIQILLNYCNRHEQMERLLRLVQERNPHQYARFEKQSRK